VDFNFDAFSFDASIPKLSGWYLT